jgi:hypothetical protein
MKKKRLFQLKFSLSVYVIYIQVGDRLAHKLSSFVVQFLLNYITEKMYFRFRVSHQKHQVRFSWGLSAIRELPTPTKL